MYVKQRSNITKSDIEMLCNIIYEINQAKCKDIIQQNYTLNKSQKQNIKSLLKILDKVILIAKNEMTNKYDEKSILFKSSVKKPFRIFDKSYIYANSRQL